MAGGVFWVCDISSTRIPVRGSQPCRTQIPTTIASTASPLASSQRELYLQSNCLAYNPQIALDSLSAYLAETTGDAKYLNAAIASATWMKNLQINSDNIILDTVNAKDCSRTPATWFALFTLTPTPKC